MKTAKQSRSNFTSRNVISALCGCLSLTDSSDDVGIDNAISGTHGGMQLHKLAAKQVIEWRKISNDFVARLRKSETRENALLHANTLLQRAAGAFLAEAPALELCPVRNSNLNSLKSMTTTQPQAKS